MNVKPIPLLLQDINAVQCLVEGAAGDVVTV
jgi:hypothetical protein